MIYENLSGGISQALDLFLGEGDELAGLAGPHAQKTGNNVVDVDLDVRLLTNIHLLL